MIDDLRDQKLPAGEMAWRMSLAHCSILGATSASGCDRLPTEGPFGRVLSIISPYSSYAMGMLIQHDWNRIEADLPAWPAKLAMRSG